MEPLDLKYRPIPFWSWNDELEPEILVRQIHWMHENGIGGFFMHARGGLKTPYLGQKWFQCVDACVEEANKLGMKAYAYDENGWPSGFAGGKLLEDESNRDRYLECAYGPYDEKALVSYDDSGDSLVRVNSGKRVLNIYKRISNSTVDILNRDVVGKFIGLTHEEYKKRDKGGLQGFFTDEPQYYRWGHPYTDCLPEYFKEHYGTDILDGLGLMFVEKEGYRQFRYQYWKAMQDLMLHSYSEQIYSWCDANGYKLTGHYVEEVTLFGQMWCCGGVMPMYEFEHIPGVDWLGRSCPDIVSPKQVGSASSQLGKKQVITEAFAASGWDVTPLELKRNGDALYWGGVNLICHHLLPYAEHGQRKRDYPAHFTPLNGWVDNAFREFNDYFSYLGRFLSESEENPQIAVLQPIRSAYFNYKRMTDDPYFGIKDVEVGLEETVLKLTSMHLSWHFVDETLLAKHGFVKEGKLFCGRKGYSILVLPKVLTMDKTTEAYISEFLKQGGRLFAPYGLPEYLEGEKHDYSSWAFSSDLALLRGIDGFTCPDSPDYRLSLRKDENGEEYLFIMNALEKEIPLSFSKKGMHGFASLDVKTGKRSPLPLEFVLEKGGSKVLYWTKDSVEKKRDLPKAELPKTYRLCSPVGNIFTLDKLSYSLDGVSYSDEKYHLDVLNELLQKRYQGKLFLKYSFEAKSLPPSCVLEVEDDHLLSVSCNGKECKRLGPSSYEKALVRYSLGDAMKIGENEVLIQMDYFQNEAVYYALFGENVTESLRNCLIYDCNIEPIYLKGQFGVYGEFRQGETPRDVLGRNFYLGEQKKEIASLIEDGFPFFHGDIALEGELEAPSEEMMLSVEGRFHYLKIEINGTQIPGSLFAYQYDLAGPLRKGKNKIRLTLTVSPRNCMGPHHTGVVDAIMWAGPNSFEKVVDKDVYGFVKTLL